jgi:hypothetical protein
MLLVAIILTMQPDSLFKDKERNQRYCCLVAFVSL